MCELCCLTRSSNVKSAVEFWIFIFFFVLFCRVKKRTNCCASFVMKSHNLFLILKVPQNKFQRNIKIQNNKNHLIFNTNFNIPLSVKMIRSTHKSPCGVICKNLHPNNSTQKLRSLYLKHCQQSLEAFWIIFWLHLYSCSNCCCCCYYCYCCCYCYYCCY